MVSLLLLSKSARINHTQLSSVFSRLSVAQHFWHIVFFSLIANDFTYLCANSSRECTFLREKTIILYNHKCLNTEKNMRICSIPEKQCSSETIFKGIVSVWWVLCAHFEEKSGVFIHAPLDRKIFEIDFMGKAKYKFQRTTWKLLSAYLNWKHLMKIHFLWVPTAPNHSCDIIKSHSLTTPSLLF